MQNAGVSKCLTHSAGEPSHGDFDGDGRKDFVIPECYGAQHEAAVHVYECTGNDQYAHIWECVLPSVNCFWSSPGPDLDQDGRGDFFVLAGEGGERAAWSVFMFETTADDAFALVWQHRLSGGWIHGGLATGDIDGDGIDELVCQVADRSQLLRCNGDNSFEVTWALLGPVIGQGEHRVVAPDLDRDGFGELVWWTSLNDESAGVAYEKLHTTATVRLNLRPTALLEARPNPFSQVVWIGWSDKSSNNPPLRTALASRCPASALGIFDSGGRQVRSLALETHPHASRGCFWDGSDDAGRLLPTGCYFIRSGPGNEGGCRITLVR